MKIIVLAGGLSTERDVSLTSSAGICKTLIEKGHDAFLLDVFMGLPDAPENLEEVFTVAKERTENYRQLSICWASVIPARILWAVHSPWTKA